MPPEAFQAEVCAKEIAILVTGSDEDGAEHREAPVYLQASKGSGSLDVSAATRGAEDGSALQLDAVHHLGVQDHRLMPPVVEAPEAVPANGMPSV